MKLYLPLIASITILASCSTAYKTGQTPDDVYFSPARMHDEYARKEEKEEGQYRDQLQNEEELREDRYLRMKTSYRRYSVLDDCDCYCYTGSSYNRYYDYYRHNNIGLYWTNWSWSSYNPYYYNPYYNKPYYSGYVAGNVKPIYNKPRSGNLFAYDGNSGNTNNSNSSPKGKKNYSNSSSSDNNYRGSGNSAGGFLRDVFNSGSNNSNSSSSSSSSSSNSSSSKSSGSSSGSSSAPVRKF